MAYQNGRTGYGVNGNGGNGGKQPKKSFCSASKAAKIEERRKRRAQIIGGPEFDPSRSRRPAYTVQR